MFDSGLLEQFSTIVIIHLLGVMSPGPDFLLILKQSLCEGRKSSLATSIGIGSGIVIHITFCIFGLGFILSSSRFLFDILLILGSLYIIYMGLQSLYEKRLFISNKYVQNKDFSFRLSFFRGFITNVLNPKATLFFLSVYTLVINENTSIYIQLFYGLWMVLATMCWFSLLSYILTGKAIANKLTHFTNKIQKLMGIVFIFLGMRILLLNVYL